MQKKQEKTGLIWFRNDLRTKDNCALVSAIKANDQVVGLYCYDPRHFDINEFGHKKTAVFRAQFLIETVTDLKEQLLKLNIPLLIYNKTPETVIPKLVREYNISNIHFQKEWTPEENIVLDNIKQNLPRNIHFFSEYDQFLYHPKDSHLTCDAIPNVFTQFRKHVEKRSIVQQERQPLEIINQEATFENNTKNITLDSLGFSKFERHINSAFPFKGGETEALNRLNYYLFESKKIGFYKKTRNGLIGPDFSSKFSPWLANGSLSPRTIYWQVKKFEDSEYKNQSTYWLIFELIWRDYFKYISLKYGSNIFKLTGILNKKYSWKTDQLLINRWINGQTDEPFVNANMLELKQTGWMSNRGRQNVASYFSKTLNLDWRIGASYFESLLIDYDVHSNYGNWMYVSGVGNDPRDRTFNVKLQAKRYDPNAKYQRLWLQNTLF